MPGIDPAALIQLPPALRARDAVYFALEDAFLGVTISRDVGSFHPQPLGFLVGLPALASRGLAARTYTVPVHVVSADPLNTTDAVDALYALADAAVIVLGAAEYAPQDWPGGVNRDPLPSVLVLATITVTEEGD
jgi:hypothetical protein